MTEPHTHKHQSLLPPNATALGHRLVHMGAPRVTPEALRTLYDPARIPADHLPWLAWGEDVPVWPDSEALRRDIILKSHRWHGQIGTAAGLRTGARLNGAEITRLITPPAKTFLGGWSEAARRDWLDAMPQLRLYPYRARSEAQSPMLGGTFVGSHPARSDAVFRATTRTTLWHPDGREVELTTREWQGGTAKGNATLELARHDNAPGLHLGQPLSGHVARYTAAQRLWRLDQQAYQYGTATLSIRTTAPSLSPLSTDVEIVAQRAARPAAMLAGLPLGGSHLCQLDGETRYYRRTYLHDPAVAGRTTASPAHLGATRLGMLPFETEARVRMPARRSRTLHINGFLGAAVPARRDTGRQMAATLDTLDWFRAEADKIRIDTRHTSPLLARQTLIAGDYTAGQLIDR